MRHEQHTHCPSSWTTLKRRCCRFHRCFQLLRQSAGSILSACRTSNGISALATPSQTRENFAHRGANPTMDGGAPLSSPTVTLLHLVGRFGDSFSTVLDETQRLTFQNFTWQRVTWFRRALPGGFCNARNVASFPGATGSPSNVLRAPDISSKCTIVQRDWGAVGVRFW